MTRTIEIGDTYRLYKTCKICEDTKMIYEFVAKGKGKRRSHCKDCIEIKKSLPRKSDVKCYTYDVSILRESDINVTYSKNQKLTRYSIKYKQAVAWVEGGDGICGHTVTPRPCKT